MFANRYTALIDACSLADSLRRNLLLTLAEAEFFRVRWSATILDETARAVTRMATDKGVADASERGRRACAAMAEAFPDAMVDGFDHLLATAAGLPDPDDQHVLAAAIKIQAQTIVTENLRHFPDQLLAPLGLEARSADDFIADTIALDLGRAVPAVSAMRRRFRRPALSAELLLRNMEARGLSATVETLAPHVRSI